MKIVVQAVIISILFLVIGESLKTSSYSPHYKNPHYSYPSARFFNIGDSSEWSSKFYDHTSWLNKRLNFDTTAIFWVRGDLVITESQNLPLGLKISALASSEIYFDGVRIGSSGNVGQNKLHETEGNITHVIPIPDSLATAGPHVVAIRASNFHTEKISFFSLEVGNLSKLFLGPLKFTLFIFLFAGAFLIIAVFYLFIYQKIQHHKAILFGLLCACFFVLIPMEYLKFYYFYPYSFQIGRITIIEIITTLIAVIMPFFLLNRFQLKRHGLVMALVIISVTMVELRIVEPTSHDLRLMYLYTISLVFSLFIVIIAIRQRKKGAGLSLTGLIPCFFIFHYYDSLLFISFFTFVLYNLISLSSDHAQTIDEKNEALIQSARLELDLLKKNIQPHFLMNTLTSVMEWIERDPQQGVKLIEQLAKEFKVLLEISDQRLISMQRELELCKLHLEIMSFKKQVQHSFDHHGIDPDARIPPGVLHTIVENGISHSTGKTRLRFVLSERKQTKGVCYEFLVSGEKTAETKLRSGTGTRYIKARLQEAFDDGWDFSQQATDAGWLSTIRIYGNGNTDC